MRTLKKNGYDKNSLDCVQYTDGMGIFRWSVTEQTYERKFITTDFIFLYFRESYLIVDALFRPAPICLKRRL